MYWHLRTRQIIQSARLIRNHRLDARPTLPTSLASLSQRTQRRRIPFSQLPIDLRHLQVVSGASRYHHESQSQGQDVFRDFFALSGQGTELEPTGDVGVFSKEGWILWEVWRDRGEDHVNDVWEFEGEDGLWGVRQGDGGEKGYLSDLCIGFKAINYLRNM